MNKKIKYPSISDIAEEVIKLLWYEYECCGQELQHKEVCSILGKKFNLSEEQSTSCYKSGNFRWNTLISSIMSKLKKNGTLTYNSRFWGLSTRSKERANSINPHMIKNYDVNEKIDLSAYSVYDF